MNMELRMPDERMKRLIAQAVQQLALAGVEFTIETSMTDNFTQQEIVAAVMAAHGVSLVDIIKSLPISDADRLKALEGTHQAMKERFHGKPMSDS
jgi:hypothetical protein